MWALCINCVEFGQLANVAISLQQSLQSLHVQTNGLFFERIHVNECRTLNMSSFLIFCSLEIPAIFRSQLAHLCCRNSVLILFSRYQTFRSVSYKKIGCIIVSYIFSLLIICFSKMCLCVHAVVPARASI